MPEIAARGIDAAAFGRLTAAGCDPRLARLFAARGLTSMDELATTLKSLASPERLHHVDDAARLLADAIARKRAHAHRRRLRRRRRHGLRGRREGAARDGSERRLPRAEPLRARLRPHAGDRAGGGEAHARPPHHRRQRHRGGRGHRRSEPPRHARAGDRPPPAGRPASRRRVHRESQPGRLRIPEQEPRGRGRDLLRDARAARGAAPARRVHVRASRAEPRGACSTWWRSAPSPTW